MTIELYPATTRVMRGTAPRWSEKVMSEEVKAWVRKTMWDRVMDLGLKITDDNIKTITQFRTIAAAFSDPKGPGPGDVAWAWIAEQQESTNGIVADSIQRRSTGLGAAVIPRWQFYTAARTGWQREAGLTEAIVNTMRDADMVMMHLVQEETGMRFEDWVRTEDRLTISKGTMGKAWHKVKGRFPGKGGYRAFLEAAALRMLKGDLEGGLGEEDPMAQSWWQGAVQTANTIWGEGVAVVISDTSVPLQEPGAFVASETDAGVTLVEVVVDWMSCTQSLRLAVEEQGEAMYIGLDIQKWVFSHAMKGWVRNLQVDLMQLKPWELWEIVCEEARRRAGPDVEVVLRLLAMSPCCKTFSKADSSNTTRGNNYRLHGQNFPERPPKDETSDKGKEAHDADLMVKKGIALAKWAKKHLKRAGKGVSIYMENPVGSLCRRPYMVRWEESKMVKKEEVHYCAYDHVYHKPTHIWTTMKRWKKKGRTGTGMCSKKCRAGQWKGNQWVHRYKIAQASSLAKGGIGRKAFKNMMPKMLHMEMLEAAKK